MAARLRAKDVLQRLPAGKVLVAEIGVHQGKMSKFLLERHDLHLVMVDNWTGRLDWPKGYRPSDMEMNKQLALEATEFAGNRRTVIHADSIFAAKEVKDRSLDLAFIDADHTYESVRADIEAWEPKVKGTLAGHDYQPTFPGVIRAVDEAVAKNGWKLTRGQESCWYVVLNRQPV